MFSRRRWIPPGALLFAQAAHGFSWLLLGWAAWAGIGWPPTLVEIAWIHAVALGWATGAAVGVLLHVVPQFADVRWRFETVARRSVFFYALGVALFVLALLAYPAAAQWAAALIVLALLAYLFAAFATLAQALRGERVERAIARALGTTLGFLLLTALAGAALTALLSGRPVGTWVAIQLPPVHAVLGLFGWLSLLIFGVSTRTVRPITGNRSRFRWAHIAVGSLAVVGALLLAVGLGGVTPLMWPGAAIFGIGAAIYIFDVADVLRRATVTHRVPQAFIGAALVWLACGLIVGAATLAGAEWQTAFGFVLLAGWIGQMVNAHVYHIGVRLLLTVYRGEDDETLPGTVLNAGLSWLSFASFQLAVALTVGGLLSHAALPVAVAAALGIAGWIAMIANLAGVRRRITNVAIALG